jgi:glycosyltransferase involved in cell wall biosynthesis
VKISATIIVLNEEKNIGDCLASLGFADEIVVVDSGSSDRTEEICRADSRVQFYQREWQGFGPQKNLAASLASNDWIFNIDADERVSKELLASIDAVDPAQFAVFRAARRNFFGSRWIRHCGWYPDYNMRLYDRRQVGFRERSVHEAIDYGGPVGTLDGDLIHFTYTDIADYLKRMDRYSTLAANEIVKTGKTPGIAAIVVRPLFTFFKMYILRKGLLEGYHGLLLSALYACYTFAKYAKARELITEKPCQ